MATRLQFSSDLLDGATAQLWTTQSSSPDVWGSVREQPA